MRACVRVQVLECNGVAVKNLKHLAALIKDGESGKEAFQKLIMDDSRVIILEVRNYLRFVLGCGLRLGPSRL